MAKLSDDIENFLKEMIEMNDGHVEVQRIDLAGRFNCVPSQITYVLATRFTNCRGYIVESRRGGGGWVRISQLIPRKDRQSYVMHALNTIDEGMTQHHTEIFLRNFLDYEIIDEKNARLIAAACSDKTLSLVPLAIRPIVRVSIMKQMLLAMNL